LRVFLRENPIADGRVHRKTEVPDERDGAGGGVERADGGPGEIAPRAIGGFEAFEGADQVQRPRRRVAEILIRAERDEGAVGRAVGQAGVAFVAAVGFAEGLDAGEERAVEAGWEAVEAEAGPTTREGGDVDEVERGAVAMRAEETLGGRDRHGGVEGLERGEGEDRVVEIGPAGAIAGAAVGGELALEKSADEIGRVAEEAGRKAGDLEELEAETHAVAGGASRRSRPRRDGPAASAGPTKN
jgi:hypothetical protein